MTNIPNGGGKKVSREEAIAMLKGGIPEGYVLMSKEYGSIDCATCNDCAIGRCDHEDTDPDHVPMEADCPHWTGITQEDLETIEEDDEYQNFELLKK